MRALPNDLLEAQKRAPLEWPKVKITIAKRIGGIRRLDFARLYDGEDTLGPHCATMPSDSSLNRFRVDPADSKLYQQRVRYPETVGDDPAFGNTTPGSAKRVIYVDDKGGCKFTLASGTTIASLKAYGAALFANCKAKAVIYDDNAGAPGDLVATSQEVTGIDSTPAWRTFAFATPVDLAAGVYWLTLIIDDATYITYGQTGASNQTALNDDTYADGPADPFGDVASYYADALAIYAVAANWPSWTDTGETAGALASDWTGANVILAFVDNASPYHVWIIESSDSGASWGAAADTGAVSDANGHVAVARKSDGTIGLFYTRGSNLYARKKPNGGWSGEFASAYGLTSISGVAVIYECDWDLIITGVDGDSQDGVWSTIFGDGSSEAVESWDDLREIMLRESTEPFTYTAPFLAYSDVFRCFFVERYTDPTTQDRVYFTYSPATTDWVNNLWREPIPFDLETVYGLALAYDTQNVWLCNPRGVWKAFMGTEEWDITDKVVEIWETDAPIRGRSTLKVILDNTAGLFNNFDKLGYEIVFGKGYQTASGPLYSEGSSFWITNYRFVSPPWFPLRMIYPVGVIGTLEIHCEGFWDLCKRYKFRRQIEWAAGEKNCFQILSWIMARLGFEFSSAGSSSIGYDLYPPLTIRADTKAYTVIRKIMSWMPDVLWQRGHFLYVQEPAADDPVDYVYDNIYGISHVVYRGNYGVGASDPNRAQVWGDAFMAEGFDFDSIEQVYDRLVTRSTPEYATVAAAAARAAAELRTGQVLAAAPGWAQVTTNCGQEPMDVITITDSTAGVVAIKRRVLAVRTHWRKPFLYHQVLELGAP